MSEMGPKASMVSPIASVPSMSNATSANSDTLHHARATRIAAPTLTTEMMADQYPKVTP